MRRVSEFDKSKLIEISSKKSVANIYVNAFPIEQVQVRIATYGPPQQFIDIFIDFAEFLRITQDVKSGKLFKDLEKSNQQIVLARGGTPASRSKREDGQAESRTLTIGLMNNAIFLNASSGPGTSTETGAITPSGAPDKKVSASMSIDDCKKLFLYTEAAIQAYLPTIVNQLVNYANSQRNQNS